MRTFFFLSVLALGVTLMQAVLLTPLVPPQWSPELGLLFGLASIAFLPIETALFLIFAFGVLADLQGSTQFGAFTFSYLVGAGALMEVRRGLTRGGLIPTWFGVIVGVAVTHLAYMILGAFSGWPMPMEQALNVLGQYALLATLYGGLTTHLMGRFCYRLDLLSVEAQRYYKPPKHGKLLLRTGGS